MPPQKQGQNQSRYDTVRGPKFQPERPAHNLIEFGAQPEYL